MRVFEISLIILFLLLVTVFPKNSSMFYPVCLLWHFLWVLMKDVLGACFSMGWQSLEVIHQNMGCQNNVVVPLKPCIRSSGGLSSESHNFVCPSTYFVAAHGHMYYQRKWQNQDEMPSSNHETPSLQNQLPCCIKQNMQHGHCALK